MGKYVTWGLPRRAWFGKKMGIGLFARLKLAMHPILPNITCETFVSKAWYFHGIEVRMPIYLTKRAMSIKPRINECISLDQCFFLNLAKWTKCNCSSKGLSHTQVGLVRKLCNINKTNIKVYIGKIGFFQIACSLRYSHMGCGVQASQCDDQVRKGQWSCWPNSS